MEAIRNRGGTPLLPTTTLVVLGRLVETCKVGGAAFIE